MSCREKETKSLPPPLRPAHPFFAYGIFRPGQLAYLQLGELVTDWRPEKLRGELRLRDGLPIADLDGEGTISGAVLTFAPALSDEAYQRIAEMGMKEHYRWEAVWIAEADVNVLVGRSPRKGSDPFEKAEWDGWDDPLLTAALDVIDEMLDTSMTFEWDLKPLFRLQMAYLLLWSSIERYASLRYHLGSRVLEKVRLLSREDAFRQSLPQQVKKMRKIYRADRPSDHEVLDPSRPDKAIDYYYQVRSNITHRGKSAIRDHETVRQSLIELLAIFRQVLTAARSDAEDLAAHQSCPKQGGF